MTEPAKRAPAGLPCWCEFVDDGIGMMKVDENPECPRCTETGYQVWLYGNGTAEEILAAEKWLNIADQGRGL